MSGVCGVYIYGTVCHGASFLTCFLLLDSSVRLVVGASISASIRAPATAVRPVTISYYSYSYSSFVHENRVRPGFSIHRDFLSFNLGKAQARAGERRSEVQK